MVYPMPHRQLSKSCRPRTLGLKPADAQGQRILNFDPGPAYYFCKAPISLRLTTLLNRLGSCCPTSNVVYQQNATTNFAECDHTITLTESTGIGSMNTLLSNDYQKLIDPPQLDDRTISRNWDAQPT